MTKKELAKASYKMTKACIKNIKVADSVEKMEIMGGDADMDTMQVLSTQQFTRHAG